MRHEGALCPAPPHHTALPQEKFTETVSSPCKSLVHHPCSNLMERGPEMKNLHGISNSSQPLVLHRTSLKAHFSWEKRLQNPLSLASAAHTGAPLSPEHSLNSSLAPRARAAWTGFPGSAPIDGIVPKEICISGTRHSSISSQEAFPTEKEHVEKFSFFNRKETARSPGKKK